jgi:death-on-curing protein
MRFLNLQDVLTIHRTAIHQYGGSHGIRDLGLLESALAAPHHSMFGEDLYPDLVAKCAILLYLLIENHPFVDGNKRTAFLAALRFVELNGSTFDATEDELYDLTISIASGQQDKDTVTAWIRKHLCPLKANQ